MLGLESSQVSVTMPLDTVKTYCQAANFRVEELALYHSRLV